MKARKLSIGALAGALVTAVILSFVLRPGFQVTAAYRMDTLCEEVVKNGGFETDGDWTIPVTESSAAYSTYTAHSGQRSMLLGIPEGCNDKYAYSSIYQDVTIPSEASSATLSFWYKPYTDASGWDLQQVLLYDTGWHRLETVLQVLSDSRTWTHHTFDVSSYAGETLRLYFSVYNHYYLYGPTGMYVDDVSLRWCREAAPLARIEVSPAAVTLARNDTQQFVATGYDTHDNVVAITPTWSVADPTAGSIDATGLFTAGTTAGAYPAAVVATADTITGTADVTVVMVTKLAFSPSYQTVFTHTSPFTFTTNVVITDVSDLAGFEFDVMYNPNVVRVVDMVLGDFLGSTGREVNSFSDGTLSADGQWSFRAWSGNDHPAPEGSGVLATTFLSPIAIGETDLSLQNAQLASSEIVTIPFESRDGHVVVSCFGDCNGDGRVDVLDLLIMAKHWYCRCGDECYDALYDVDADCEIRAADMMQVAIHWGACGSEASALLQGAKVSDAATPTVRIEPSETSIWVGETFIVTVEISDALDLGLFQFDLHYDPELVQVSQVTPGDFLGSTGRDVMYDGQIDNENGVTRFDAMSFPPGVPGPEGKGDLAYIWLTAQNIGESELLLTNVRLQNTQAKEQKPSVQGPGVVKIPGIYLPLIVRE